MGILSKKKNEDTEVNETPIPDRERISACSFTGHREIKSEHLQIVCDRLARAVEYAYSKGCRDFYAGGAIGFDTLAAKEVIRFSSKHRDVKLHLVLPCKNQDLRWSSRQKDEYYDVMKKADSIEYVSELYTQTCMRQRNARLVELCDTVIAYMGRSGSGTAQTVRMATRDGKRIFNIYPSDAPKKTEED